MNAQVTPEIQPFVAVIHGEIKTTSLKIAEHFRKPHRDVLEKIKNLECSPEFTERNFSLSEYKDSTGRKLPYYEVTSDGFTFIAMGYTGKKAAILKEAYINAFNAMAKELHQLRLASQSNQLPEPPTISNAQQGILLNLIADKTRATGRHNSYYLGLFKNHFKLASYKYLPAERFEEGYEFLSKLDGDALDSLVMLTRKELAAITVAKEKIEAYTLDKEKSQEGHSIIPINIEIGDSKQLKRFLIYAKGNVLSITPVKDEEIIMTTKEIEENFQVFFPGKTMVNLAELSTLLQAAEKIKI